MTKVLIRLRGCGACWPGLLLKYNKVRISRIAAQFLALSRESLTLLHANNKTADQSAYAHSLISTFVIQCLKSVLFACLI